MGRGRETSEAGCAEQEERLQAQTGVQSSSIPARQPLDVAAAALAAAAAASEPPQASSLPVPHIQQAYNWDCGLACVLMVLRALDMRQHHFGTLLDMCPTRSIWTIDLAHLLAKCGAAVQMMTVTLGANQTYSGEQFYAETMQDDFRRVDGLFQAAAAAGISVQRRSLPLAHLRSLLLGGGCLLIALVDKMRLASASLATHSSGGLGSMWSPGGVRRSGRLAPEDGGGRGAAGDELVPEHGSDSGTEASHYGSSRSSSGAAAVPLGHAPRDPASSAATAAAAREAAAEAVEPEGAAVAAAADGKPAAGTAAAGPAGQEQATLAPGAAADGSGGGGDTGYLGHYIVLCGYDARSDEFELRDPASDRPRLWIPAARLDAARKCFGTDEDLLLVALPAAPAAAAGARGAAAGPAPGAGGAAAGLPPAGLPYHVMYG
ncbi:hypothetical protein ABPG75_008346 [Micractinium tetrahymenae]